MSGSYKKFPCCKDGNRRKKADKQIANRKIRRSTRWRRAHIPNGGAYRKISNSYRICDFRSVWTFRDKIELHQSRYDKCAAEYGADIARQRYSKDWRELYREWARYCLWK